MNIKIYQINLDRDRERLSLVAFEDLATMRNRLGISDIDSSLYDLVFEGTVPCDNLDEVYEMFNVNIPDDYRGRSLSVSDVVQVIINNRFSLFWYVDSLQFSMVDFKPSKTLSKL